MTVFRHVSCPRGFLGFQAVLPYKLLLLHPLSTLGSFQTASPWYLKAIQSESVLLVIHTFKAVLLWKSVKAVKVTESP